MPKQPRESLKVDQKRWNSAYEWALTNAKRLGFFFSQSHLYSIVLSSGQEPVWTSEKEAYIASDISLEFELGSYNWGKKSESYLKTVQFSASQKPMNFAYWNAQFSETEPPQDLASLITEGKVIGNRPKIVAAAKAIPAFNTVYKNIFRRLFPAYEHHELHYDIEDYEESLARDDALLSRLRKSQGRSP